MTAKDALAITLTSFTLSKELNKVYVAIRFAAEHSRTYITLDDIPIPAIVRDAVCDRLESDGFRLGGARHGRNVYWL